MLIFCDLDESLVANDVSVETIMAAAIVKPCAFIKELLSGEKNLKPRLKELALKYATFDAVSLSYREEVIAYLNERKEAGDRIFLLTASHQEYANAVGQHLGIFEDVFGSNRERNIKGKEKVKFIREKFGAVEFSYIGDTSADIPIWKESARPVIVAPKETTLNVGLNNVVNIPIIRNGAKDILKAVRPQQWLKNCLLFLPLFLAEAPIKNSENIPSQIIALIFGFIAFSLLASSVYILNDVVDAANDRKHPTKKNRAIASGKITIRMALILFVTLFISGLLVSFGLGKHFFNYILLYFFLTTAYTFNLKKVPILDIIVLALLYTIRIIAGGAVVDVFVSQWLKAFSIFFFLSLAAVKRATELLRITKNNGRGYDHDDYFLIQQIGVSAGLISVLVLAEYINSNKGAELYVHPNRLWWICLLLLYWISRLWLITSRGKMKDDPVAFAVTDKESYLILFGCILTIILAI